MAFKLRFDGMNGLDKSERRGLRFWIKQDDGRY